MDIQYDCRWTKDVDDLFITNYNEVRHQVFGGDYTIEAFKRQFTDNIYGDSVVVVVYIDGRPVAARALWRNDINGMEAYQPGQTCVTEQCRGKGIFSKMTRLSVNMLPPKSIIYNYPNKNSYPGYLKMGWQLEGEYRPRVLFSYKQYKKEHPIDIDKGYAEWWLKGREGIKYVKQCGEYYLCRHDTPRPYFHIIGHTNEQIAKQFPKAGTWGILFFLSKCVTFYNKKYEPLRIVANGEKIEHIPTWKIDSI